MSFLDGRRYFVHGLGISGQAAAKLLAEDGREVVAFDENPTVVADYARLLGSESYGRRVSVVSPEDAEQALALCDRMVLSPGVPLNNPLVSAAKVLAIPVDSEIEAAFHYTNADIVAVTGTNGKSTTVGIVGAILQTAGVSAVVAGNVGTPFTSVVRGGDFAVFVLELSSFQLDTISEFRANVAVLLNITPDHLDRYHHSFDEYVSSKARILNRSDEATGVVYNADDVACVRRSERFDGFEFPFSS
ncbi:MAG: UDP-N-acetylmuramoyl-L-alanine--D-glutamate ligase, partial [Candidatus Krumholzibacteria bacterium]|nr:UDP-N-acetylmuramoyl-L-alanine--D-glutamate ligase [Candidatus Krumholzibacteria bacterium]